MLALIFFQSLLIGYSGALMPGSLLTYTIDKGLRSGAKAGLLISAGHAVLEFFLLGLLFFGFGKFLEAERVRALIGLAGGFFLLVLAFPMIFRENERPKKERKREGEDKKQERQLNLFAGGAFLSLANPYFLLWWAVLGLSLAMAAYGSLGFVGIAAFYFGHILADISWYTLVAFLMGKTGKFLNQKVYKLTIIFLGLLMAGFGISFIIGALKYFIK